MKRIFDTRSKSAETLAMVSTGPSFGVAVEPQCKKQRQSVIKQSVKRLFGSVKRLLPSSHRRKDKVGLEEATNVFFTAPETVKKSAAMLEAESFIARLGTDWTVTQVNDRIAYLYRLVNDAFERAYQQTLQEKTAVGPNQNTHDYIAEIRRLQAMIADRQQVDATSHITNNTPRQSLSYSADNIAAIPTQRASSVDVCQQTHTVQPQFEFAAVTPAFTRPFSPTPPTTFTMLPIRPANFTEGMECNGVFNNVALGPFYTLSQSHANVPPLGKSDSKAEVQSSALNIPHEANQQHYNEPVYQVLPEISEDEEMEVFGNFEEKIQLFERISKSGLCSIGSIGHDRKQPTMSLPNLSRPRSFEQSQDILPSNHAHHQSFSCIPIGNAVMQTPNLPQNSEAQSGSLDFYVVDQSDCSSRRCSVRELAKMFENTTI